MKDYNYNSNLSYNILIEPFINIYNNLNIEILCLIFLENDN